MKRCCAYCRLVVIDKVARRADGLLDVDWQCLYEGTHHSRVAVREDSSLFMDISCRVYDPIPEEEVVALTLAGRFG